jgi:hypothetical protein
MNESRVRIGVHGVRLTLIAEILVVSALLLLSSWRNAIIRSYLSFLRLALSHDYSHDQ